MLNFKNEYYLLEKGRVLYPTAFTDLVSIEVYGSKEGGVTGTEDTAHIFKIPNNYYTLNAGNIDFSNYPDGIENDFKSIKIVNIENLISLPVNFNEWKDITPDNLKVTFEKLGLSVKDVQKRLSEVGLYIDSNLPGEIGLPKLPVGCTWYCNQDGHITAIPINDLYGKFNQMIEHLKKILEEYATERGLLSKGIIHEIHQPNHGFIFEPITYDNGVWRKADISTSADGMGVIKDNDKFYFVEAGEIEIPKDALDKDGQEILEDEYYYLNENGVGLQREEPLYYYQPILHTRRVKNKLVADVNIETMEDLRSQVVDTDTIHEHGLATLNDIPQTFDTIARLQKSFWLREGQVVEVLGYYEAGDGAGHKRIIASEDDGSGIQLNNGLWANIVHNGEVNVSWFGAKGDGVTDDSLAIQKAINTLSFKNRINNSIFFPPKKFVIKKVLNLPYEITFSSFIGFGTVLFFDLLEQFFVIDESEYIKFYGITFEGKDENKKVLFKNKNKWGSSDIDHTFYNCNFIKFSYVSHIYGRGLEFVGCVFANISNAIFKKFNHEKYDVQSTFDYRRYILTGCDFDDCQCISTTDTDSWVRGMYISGCSGMLYEIAKGNYENCIFDINCYLIQKTPFEFINASNIEIRGIYHTGKFDETSGTGIYSNFLTFENYLKKINIQANIKGCKHRLIYSINGSLENCNVSNSIINLGGESGKRNIIFECGKLKNISLSSSKIITNQITFVYSKVDNTLTVSDITKGINTFLGIVESENLYIKNNVIYMEGLDTVNTEETKSITFSYPFSESKYSLYCHSAGFSSSVYSSFYYLDTQRRHNGFNVKSFIVSSGSINSSSNNFYWKVEAHITKAIGEYVNLMIKEKVLDDHIKYQTKMIFYNKQQRKLEQDRQLAYEEALKENSNLSYEEFMSVQPMTLNLVEEPQPSEALKKFMEKYL